MARNRFKRIALYATIAVGVVVAAVGLLLGAEQRRIQQETGSVLSAFFSEVVLRGAGPWDGRPTITIAIMRNPEWANPQLGDNSNSPSWFARSLKSRLGSVSGGWFVQSARTTRASFFLNSM